MPDLTKPGDDQQPYGRTDHPPAPQQGWPAPPATPPAVWQGYPPGYQQGPPPPVQDGPIGQVRGTGTAILLTIVTVGIYPLYWYYVVHEEMKRHTGQGLGGGLALLIAFLVGAVQPFITSHEVGELYTRRGWRPPVSGLTGLWYFPGMVILVGPLVWFIQTNGAINDYWKALGAR